MVQKTRDKMIVGKVIEQAQERAVSGRQSLKRLKIGLRYAAAELSDGSVGISFRFQDDPFHIIDKNLGVVEAGAIPLTELIKWAADDRSLLYSSIGLAVCNALAPWDEVQPPENADIIDSVDIRDGDIVGMVILSEW